MIYLPKYENYISFNVPNHYSILLGRELGYNKSIKIDNNSRRKHSNFKGKITANILVKHGGHIGSEERD